MNHGYQLRGYQELDWASFENHLRGLCLLMNCDLIAEELSEEALRTWECSESVARYVAHQLGTNHLFCDPDSEQRKMIGIPAHHELVSQALKQLKDLNQLDALVGAREKGFWEPRERYWLEKLLSASFGICIFLTGARHVETFGKLLRQQSWQVTVASEDWAPPPPV